MSNKEALHQLYLLCQKINFDESYDIVSSAETPEESDFFKMATDLILVQKQKKAILENKY